jgi:glycogen operon protein
VKNFLALLLFGVGTPMLLMGDEVRRTQRGNNNAYCQNNELTWFDWSLVDRHADVHRFIRTLIGIRTGRALAKERNSLSLAELLRRVPMDWHGVRLHQPDWLHDSRTLSMTTHPLGEGFAYHLIANAYWEPLEFELPVTPAGSSPWRRLVDTSLAPPADAYPFADAPAVVGRSYPVPARTVVLLYDDSSAR